MKLWNRARFWLAFWGGKAFLARYLRTGHARNDRPGMVSMRLYGDFLKYIAKPRLTIVVTGTNGKTTIATMAAKILAMQGMTVSYNDWGANHHAGVARCLLACVNWRNRPVRDAAVIEMDELISPLDVPDLKPQYIIVSNIARDSMLRNGHPGYIFRCLEAAIAGTPGATVILNGDDPISCRLGEGHRRLYFGMGNLLWNPLPNLANDFPVCPACGGTPVYDYRIYRHMGQVHCPVCGFRSPRRDYLVTAVEDGQLTVQEPGGKAAYPAVSTTAFSAANQAALITMFRDMGIPAPELARCFSHVQPPACRETREEVRGISLITMAAKGQNPTAVSTVFDSLARDPAPKEIILLLDEVYETPLKTETVAWLYDTDYEFLNSSSVRKIVLGGARYLDHRLRLLLAGVPAEKLVCLRHEEDTAGYVDTEGVEKIYVLHDVNAVSRGRAVRDAVRRRILSERRIAHDL